MSDDDQPLLFPNLPRSELERSLLEVVGSAQRVLAAQGRLRSLLSATTAVTEGLDLARVLRTITESAMKLVGARYGAMGVIAPDRSLEQFIHVGMGADDVRNIGHLPEGHGLLGALIDDPRPIRLQHISDDPRSIGFPAEHPPMDSFLGVPIRVRGEVYGNLYLSDQADGEFSAEDEELLTALAASAGVAIENARLFERTSRHQAWSDASAQVSSLLLSGSIDDALTLLAERIATIASAALVCIVLPAGSGRLRVEIASGALADGIEGMVFDAAGTIAGRAIEAEQPVLADGNDESENQPVLVVGPSMAFPLRSDGGVHGAITVSRALGGARFTDDDLEMTGDFSDQASVALELARTRADRQRLELAEDRGRIARDLHDHVIQRLFGSGLALQSIATKVDQPIADELQHEIASLDAAIADIRTAIFAVTGASKRQPAFRHRVMDVVGDLADHAVFAARVTFAGPVDLLVVDELGEDAIAVVREALTNVSKHAQATHAEVSVAVIDNELFVEVTDDGVGMSDDVTRSSGVKNMIDRAAGRGGAAAVVAMVPHGTRMQWRVPMPPASPR